MQAELSDREALLDEVVTNYFRAVAAGRAPDRQELLKRYPDLVAELKEFFDDQDQVQAIAAPLRSIAPAPGAAGQTFGDFELEEELGRGGMGVVYKARQKSLNRAVALKVLPFAATMDPRQLQRFHNEAQAAANLHHTNIVPVYYVGSERGVHYYAMQLIAGRDLASVLAQLRQPAADAANGAAPMPAAVDTQPIAGLSTEGATRPREYFRTAARLGIQAAEALDHAHQQGIVHRDVKPANLLVDAAGRLWVTDFGLAQMQTDTRLTLTGDLVGTLRYMSPEQALAKRVIVDHRADIYSLGATLYELLTLEPPFRGADRHELLRQIAFEEPRPPRRIDKAIPPELETIVLKALEKNPQERYATAQELADDLERFLKDEPIQARKPGLVQRTRKWARRHRTLVQTATALVLTLLLLGGIAGWREQRREQDADAAVGRAMAEARLLLNQANANPLGDARKYDEALAAARKTEELSHGGASSAVQREAADVVAFVQREIAGAERDRRLLAALLEVVTQERVNVTGAASIDRQFAAAFATWSLDVEGTRTDDAAARLRARPAAVLTEVIAALDQWASVGRRRQMPALQRHRLADLAAALDEPGSVRSELRALLARGGLARERALGTLLVMLRPVPVPFDAGPGEDRARLRQLLGQTDAATEPILGLLTLARALHVAGGDAEAERLLRAALRARPQEVVLYMDLGDLLTSQRPARWGEAVECYQAARALRPELGGKLANALAMSGRWREGLSLLDQLLTEKPDRPFLHNTRGIVYFEHGRFKEAETEFREAIRLEPGFADAFNNLGGALKAQGKLADALEAFRKAIDLDPKLALAHFDLGVALLEQGQLAQAVVALRNAIEFDPAAADAYVNLGTALDRQGKPQEAIDTYKKAIEFEPDFAVAYYNLGVTLKDQGKLPEAVEAYLKAIEIDPKDAKFHNNLGIVLEDQGKLAEAGQAYRRAIELDPKHAAAFYNLGNVLRHQGNEAAAVDAFRKSIQLNPEDQFTHLKLGDALNRKGDLDGAIAEYEEAIRINRDFADAHCNLGDALRQKGRFVASLASYRRGLELAAKDPVWTAHPTEITHARKWVRNAERRVEVDAKLPQILNGEAMPADAGERLELAAVCQIKQIYAACARFNQEAFAEDSRPAEDLGRGLRYNAACAAALAGCGQGKDADTLDDEGRARLRRQALDWLRADLKAWAKELDNVPDKARPVVLQQMDHWQDDADFAGVRGPDALSRLPEAERDDWQKLWDDVKALRQCAAGPSKP